jgi:hypothetical protein
MIVSSVFFSVVLLALVVIVGAVIYAIMGAAVHALRSLVRGASGSSSPDTPLPRQPGVSESDARAPVASEVPSELPSSSADAMWELIQGTRRSATAPRKSLRAKFRS